MKKTFTAIFLAGILAGSALSGCGNVKDIAGDLMKEVSLPGGAVSNEKALEQAGLIAEAIVKTLETPEVAEASDVDLAAYNGWRDMTVWEVGADSFTKVLTQNLAVESFSELSHKYDINAKGFDGKVFVWIYRDIVFVLLGNTVRGDGIMMTPTAEEGYVPDPWDRTIAYDELYVQKSFDRSLYGED
ncbi:MAG: hypothetical protein IJT16_04340 [Lachnospiraceae bacterium]|nr:hypothetical protein [Lachnospiraceae bacterium]